MKRYFYFLAFIALTIGTFTSCEEDIMKSRTLSGEWTGYFGSYYIWGYSDKYGYHEVEFESDHVDMQFVPDYDNATHGYGTEVDYYSEGPYRYQYYHFDWDIINGTIYLTYPSSPDMDVAIRNYRMNNDYFSGVCGNTEFSLRKIVDYYDWSCYYDDYGYGEWNFSWAPSRSTEGGDSIATPTPEIKQGKVVRRGNRFVR